MSVSIAISVMALVLSATSFAVNLWVGTGPPSVPADRFWRSWTTRTPTVGP